jgi:hypothetical protein
MTSKYFSKLSPIFAICSTCLIIFICIKLLLFTIILWWLLIMSSFLCPIFLFCRIRGTVHQFSSTICLGLYGLIPKILQAFREHQAHPIPTPYEPVANFCWKQVWSSFFMYFIRRSYMQPCGGNCPQAEGQGSQKRVCFCP